MTLLEASLHERPLPGGSLAGALAAARNIEPVPPLLYALLYGTAGPRFAELGTDWTLVDETGAELPDNVLATLFEARVFGSAPGVYAAELRWVAGACDAVLVTVVPRDTPGSPAGTTGPQATTPCWARDNNYLLWGSARPLTGSFGQPPGFSWARFHQDRIRPFAAPVEGFTERVAAALPTVEVFVAEPRYGNIVPTDELLCGAAVPAWSLAMRSAAPAAPTLVSAPTQASTEPVAEVQP